jgi:flagellar basal-body rod protein FlgG
MIRALYTGGLGMTAQMKRMDVVSNNIANADTYGFKRDGAVTHSFTEEYLKRINDKAQNELNFNRRIGKYSQGLFVDLVYTDFAAGGLRVTNGTYDLAVAGDGFFAVRDKNGETRYTRDGAFTITAERALVTKDGFAVLDENGEPVTVPDGNITIDEAGVIRVTVIDGGEAASEEVARLRLVDFENKESLRKVGSNLYKTTDETREKAFAASVQQGTLENSNVNAVKEMVEVINISRIYEMNSRVVQNADATMGRIASEIGRKI